MQIKTMKKTKNKIGGNLGGNENSKKIKMKDTKEYK